MEDDNLVAFRYVDAEWQRAGDGYPLNPNGSVADIAGICNPAGNVVGLMPHPEDHILPIQNPLGRSDRLGLPISRHDRSGRAHRVRRFMLMLDQDTLRQATAPRPGRR